MQKENLIKSENYITILGWMSTELKLKGNDLIIYAIIYGFSQTDNQKFEGSLQYLADWTNTSKRNVMNTLQNLQEKNYIVKDVTYTRNNIKHCSYRALRGGEKISPPMK